MNYDLLKLSKILPTLNGKKTIDVFQERLDYARQVQQGGEIIQEPAKQHYISSELQSARPKPMKKEIRAGDTQSSGNILMGNFSFPIKDYSNLQVLLEGDEEADHFADMFKNSLRTASHKNQKNSFQSTGSSFFGKKHASEVSFQTRPITTSTQSNFVFRKKKAADFANKFQTDSLYHYGLEKMNDTADEDQFGLNGKKMSMREITNDVVVKQQKKYLKELKLDPLTIFRSKVPSQNDTSESPQRLTRDTLSPGYKKPFLISRCNQRSLKKNTQKSQQSFHLNYREPKPDSNRNTFTLDGSQFRTVEANKTYLTPTETPKKHSKGFSQYVNTLE